MVQPSAEELRAKSGKTMVVRVAFLATFGAPKGTKPRGCERYDAFIYHKVYLETQHISSKHLSNSGEYPPIILQN